MELIRALLEAKRLKVSPEAASVAVANAKRKLRGLLLEMISQDFAEVPFKSTTDHEAAASLGAPIPTYKTFKPEDMMAVTSVGPNVTVTVYMYESPVNKHELDARIGIVGTDKALNYPTADDAVITKINDFNSWVKQHGGADTRVNRSEPPLVKISLRIPRLAKAEAV